jgi:hypothetical protein
MFFFYFSSLDLNSHMFWYLMDPAPWIWEALGKNANAIEWFYHQIDEVLGEVFPSLMQTQLPRPSPITVLLLTNVRST